MTDPAAPHSVDLLVSGCDVVCLDADDTVIRNGAVAIDGNRIVWVGRADDAKTRFRPASRIDGTDKIAMPGLIDAHFHTAQQLLRGKIVAIGRTRQLRSPIWKCYYLPFESILDPEDVYLSGLAAYTSMISVGTTCFAEAGGPHPDEMGRAAIDTGIRGIIAQSTVDQGYGVPEAMMMDSDTAFDRNVELVKRWKDGDRVTASLALRQILVCTPDLIKSIGQAARELDVKIHTHLCEGTYEIDYALEHFGKRPAEWLAEIGVLNHHLHCAHSVLLSPNEMDLYVSHRPSSCHCSFNNYAIGYPRLMEMWRRGVDVGLGTDGAAAWGPLDMFRVAGAARVGQQAVMGTPCHLRGVATSEQLLQITCNGGARALGMDKSIGSLEPGKKADIILVDAQEPDQLPLYDPLFTAANLTTGQNVRTVVIDGRIVMKDREILTVDMDEVRSRLGRRLPDLMQRFDGVMG